MVQDFYRKVVEDSRKNEFLDYQNHFVADEVKRRVRNYRKKVVSLLGTR